VTKTTSFGVFVKLEDLLEGLLHISELSESKIASPEEVLRPGMKVEVRVIRVDVEERKIGLSFAHADFDENDAMHKQIDADNAAGVTPGTSEERDAASKATPAAAKAAKAPVEETAGEAPEAEEAKAEGVASEEAPTEEAPTEEASTEEAPTEEAPTEEASTEEAPAPEAAAEATASDDAPADDAKPEGDSA
jgi:predicted RNA-binding protein with RPS1 domain